MIKVGDTVAINKDWLDQRWRGWKHIARDRVGLVLGFDGDRVQVFWGEDIPFEEEYREQLVVL